MTIFDNIFPLGIGTARFSTSSLSDLESLNRDADLVASALNSGASYIDVAHTYSKGCAPEICRLAFSKTNAPKNVAIKVSYLFEQSSDEAQRRVEENFKLLGINHASYFMCWNIASWEQFLKITQKGGLYEGALRAKKNNLIDHITFSSHASPKEIIRMIETGLFEGVTISFSVLNSQMMLDVLDCAQKNHVGVIVMNPLGGGLIPQNQEYYSFLKSNSEETVVQAALRYVLAHPAVKIILSGISNQKQLQENLNACSKYTTESDQNRIVRVNQHFQTIEGFCTGCHYCDGCPQNINVFEMMQAYNTQLYPHPKQLYNRTDEKLLKQIVLCSRLKNNFAFLPEDSINPCIACGRCEERCTAHLPIIQRLKEMYSSFQKSCFSKKDMLGRIKGLVGNSRKIAFYPGGGYTAYVLGLLLEAYPNTSFDISLFDSNPSVWGSVVSGITVQNPKKIKDILPEKIIISNYNYSDEIYQSLEYVKNYGITLLHLHEIYDVPWV